MFSYLFLSIIFCTCSLSPLITFPPTVSPSPDLLSKLVSPSECQCLDGEAPIPSALQVQRHPVNFFTGRAGIKFQGAHNHTHAYSFSLSLACSLPSVFFFFFCFNPLFLLFSGHSSPSLPLTHSLTLSPEHPFFPFALFSSLSLPLLSCLWVKFSRCTWWRHHPGAPVSCLPSSRLLCCHRGHGEVNLETVATINSCILLF